ncbi:MAG: helix-turn-helix transcriptional regulator [Chloroflexi bacterium]|nr:helix-turn-helix transcriptional regulator [Chloroflexota bacterium]
MDDIRVGALIRSVRLRRAWRQADVAAVARVSRSQVSRVERGRLEELHVVELRAIASALEIRLPFTPLWRGGDMDRVLNERHNLMQERLAAIVRSRPDWECSAEVTFSIWGERGSIDLLAWHSSRQALLVVELKTEIPDPAALVAQVDRYRRLAQGIARERDWHPVTVSVWVIVADSSMNRRNLARHRTMLRNAYPMEGRTMRSWLRRPDGAVAALSFLADDRAGSTIRKAPPTRRVRPRAGPLLASDTLSDAPPPER